MVSEAQKQFEDGLKAAVLEAIQAGRNTEADLHQVVLDYCKVATGEKYKELERRCERLVSVLVNCMAIEAIAGKSETDDEIRQAALDRIEAEPDLEIEQVERELDDALNIFKRSIAERN